MKHFQGNEFKVEAGSLGFSITVFTITAVLSLALLVTRRWVRLWHANIQDLIKKINYDLIAQMLSCMWAWWTGGSTRNPLRFGHLSVSALDGLRTSLVSRDLRTHYRLLKKIITPMCIKLYNTASAGPCSQLQNARLSICILGDREPDSMFHAM